VGLPGAVIRAAEGSREGNFRHNPAGIREGAGGNSSSGLTLAGWLRIASGLLKKEKITVLKFAGFCPS